MSRAFQTSLSSSTFGSSITTINNLRVHLQRSSVRTTSFPIRSISPKVYLRYTPSIVARMATRSATNNGAPVKPDQMLSLGEWKKLTLDSLRRKCSDHKLEVKGKKLDLALRLFQKFHKDSVKNRRGATARKAKTPPKGARPPSPTKGNISG